MSEYTFKEVNYYDETKPAGQNGGSSWNVVSSSGYHMRYYGKWGTKNKQGNSLPDWSYSDWACFHCDTNKEFFSWVCMSNEERWDTFSKYLATPALKPAPTLGYKFAPMDLTPTWTLTPATNYLCGFGTLTLSTLSATPQENQEKDLDMGEVTMREERRFLERRLYSVEGTMEEKARKEFFIDSDESPKTRKELAERLAKGMYVIRGMDTKPDANFYDYDEDGFGCDSSLECIEWRDPAKPANREGYLAKLAANSKLLQPVRDSIQVKTPVEALTELQALEATLN